MVSPAGDAFAFAPLRPADLPLLETWLAADHVSPWFGRSTDAADDPLGEKRAVRCFIAAFAGRPIGMIQIYRWSDFPDNAAAVGALAGEVGVDYLIGEVDQLGHGLGPRLIDTFLAQQTLARSDVSGVRVDVAEANRRSWRCLEKLGFRRELEGVCLSGQSGPHYVYARDSDAAITPE